MLIIDKEMMKGMSNCFRKLLTNEKAFAILTNAPDGKSQM